MISPHNAAGKDDSRQKLACCYLSLPLDKTIGVWLFCTSVCRAGVIYFKLCVFMHSKASVLSDSSLASLHVELVLNEELRDLRDQMQLDDGNNCTIVHLINTL